jgi:hypothetical protein
VAEGSTEEEAAADRERAAEKDSLGVWVGRREVEVEGDSDCAGVGEACGDWEAAGVPEGVRDEDRSGEKDSTGLLDGVRVGVTEGGTEEEGETDCAGQ